jgi:cyclopropane-fatty-acyl-phospholipid synthase
MDRLLQFLLSRFIQRGTFKVTTSRGRTFTCGDDTGKPVAVRFTTRAAELGILLDPELKFRRSLHGWHAGRRARHDCRRAGDPLGQQMWLPNWAWPQWLLRYIGRRLAQFNPRTRARRNVAHHYDLDGRLYSLFLDADRQYSCGYFEGRTHRSTTRSSRRNVTLQPS